MRTKTFFLFVVSFSCSSHPTFSYKLFISIIMMIKINQNILHSILKFENDIANFSEL